MTARIGTTAETDLDPATEALLAVLVQAAFPEADYAGRSFFKQRPHLRLIARDGQRIVGQAGIDYRRIRVGDVPLDVAGLIDVAVAEEARGRGIGAALVAAAVRRTARADALITFADRHELYLQAGFRPLPATIRWLGLDGGRTHGVLTRDLTGILLVRPQARQDWPGGEIDLMGYLY